MLPFHRKWIRAVYSADVQIGILSCPRGSRKDMDCRAACRARDEAGLAALGSPGAEVLEVSSSLEQSRVLLNFVREALGDVEGGYRWLDSGQRLASTHKATGTKLRILSSSGKRAMGLANFSTIFADEPGSWWRNLIDGGLGAGNGGLGLVAKRAERVLRRHPGDSGPVRAETSGRDSRGGCTRASCGRGRSWWMTGSGLAGRRR